MSSLLILLGVIAALVAFGNRQNDRADLARRHFIAQTSRDLPRIERFVAREQHRFYRAFQIIDHAGCCPMGAAFR